MWRPLCPLLRSTLPPVTMVGLPAALVAAAVAVAATATAATAAAAAAPAADGGKVFTLNADCGGSCQAEVASALTARGCSDVAVLPTLRLATAVCGARRGRTVRGVDGGMAETAALQSLPGIMTVEEDVLEKGEEPLPMDGVDAEVPITGPNGEPYFWGLDRYVGWGCAARVGVGVKRGAYGVPSWTLA